MRFLAFDDAMNTMDADLFIKLEWLDDSVTWQPVEHGGIDHVIVRENKLWTPEFTKLTSTDKMSRSKRIFEPKVYYNGTVNMLIRFRTQSSCLMDLTDYPFDRQKCIFHFLPASINTVDFFLTPVSQSAFKFMSSEWNMREASFKPYKEKYSDGEVHSLYNGEIVIDRNPHFHHYFILAPAIIIAIFILTIFWLPIQSRQRFTLCTFVLMSILLLSATVKTYLPTGSTSVPLIVRYLLFELILLLITYTTILFTHNVFNNNYKTKVPDILQKIFFNTIFTRLTSSTLPPIHLPILSHTPNNKNNNNNRNNNKGGDDDDDDLSDVLKQLNGYLGEKVKEEIDTASYRQQWRQLAYIIERLIFFLIVILFLSTTTAIFANKYVQRYRSVNLLLPAK